MSLLDKNGIPFDPLNGQVDNKPKTAEAQVKKVPYEHQQVLNQMLKAIAACPMDIELKQILRMRIWGEDPTVFDPMSPERIADKLKTKNGVRVQIKDILKWEEDALYNIDQFLNQRSIVEISEKFIKDNDIRSIVNPN